MPGQKTVPFFVSTTLAGVLLIVPVALLAGVLFYAYGLLVELAQLSGLQLPFSDFLNGLILGLGALVSVIVICFMIGLALRTSIGNVIEHKYQGLLDKYVPVVGMLRGLVMQIVGGNDAVAKLRPAEVCLHGGASRQYGLIVEELPDGRAVVFVPTVPAATIGQIYVLTADAITELDTPVQDMLNAVTQWGAGATLMYKGNED